MIKYLRIYLTVTLLCSTTAISSVQAKPISPEELEENWNFYGQGSSAAQNRMFYMEEAKGSSGVMIVSPDAYEGDLIVRYELMPMSAASVCVAILFASDTGEATSLTLPKGYDGSMGHWINDVENYFLAFHNAAHDRTPFAVKFPSKESLGEYEENILRSGEFSTIEIGRQGETIWFSVNGKLLFKGEDPNPLKSGHLAFRIRGIPQQPASCLIRGLTVEGSSN
jgi:hypothetical protein